jgi:hypothetical protein
MNVFVLREKAKKGEKKGDESVQAHHKAAEVHKKTKGVRR